MNSFVDIYTDPIPHLAMDSGWGDSAMNWEDQWSDYKTWPGCRKFTIPPSAIVSLVDKSGW
ncbi:hypothetical protein [Calothrix sp. NIES-3974]|uniref:hypothetical protein n=1 Tax=Calothrix sp. NIES-3974 TaxID=2005462 RepID=UPI000BBC0392|nr:hypothetical protein [Calothrix sp. NIES-3974]